jgi:hypothetical protein
MHRDSRSNRSMSRRVLVICLVLAGVSMSTIVHAQSTKNSDPLKPYTTCKLRGGLKVMEVTRRVSKDKYRSVITAKGAQKVSVADGYRVMFSYSDLLYYYANVKIEQSDPASYLEDKETVVGELKHFATTKQATAIIFTDTTMLNGFEHYGTDRDKIDVGGQVGIHVLFDDAHKLIITIYLLNQDDKNLFRATIGNGRRFNNIEEYRKLKDEFLENYSKCLASVAAVQPQP